MEEEKKVSDESIVEEAKGETPEETTTEDRNGSQRDKRNKDEKEKRSLQPLLKLN